MKPSTNVPVLSDILDDLDGCLCSVLNPLTKSKFESRDTEGFLVGCGEIFYYVIPASTGKVCKSKHVSFIESKTYGDVYGEKEKRTTVLSDPPVFGTEADADWFNSTVEQKNTETSEQGKNEISDAKMIFGLMCDLQKIGPPENDLVVALNVEGDGEPENYEEAVNSDQKKEWKTAIKTELESHLKNEIRKIMKRDEVPCNQRSMSATWLFKRNEEGNGKKVYKARLVIREFGDTNNYDRTETYAPVARVTDVRFLLSVTNKYNLELHQLDVKTAFLNGYLEKKVYMEIPERVADKCGSRELHVCELNRALYGLRVSPRR